MSSIFRSAHRKIPSSSLKTLTFQFQRRHLSPQQNPLSPSLFRTRPFVSRANPKSPFDSNILRILRTEINYQSEYAPPNQPVTKFNSFTVEDRPGEQWIILRERFGDTEDIKIEATMFDGFETVPKLGDDSPGEEDIRLHISVIVEISKRDGGRDLEFVCSVWPDSLEIQKVYVLGKDRMLGRPYMGPDFRKLSGEIQTAFRKFLAKRGIDNKLSVFLHEYMMNKDKIELIQWLGSVESYVER